MLEERKYQGFVPPEKTRREKIVEHVMLLSNADGRIRGGDRLMRDLGMDSLDVVELVVLCENEFHADVSDELITAGLTVAGFICLIESTARV